MKKSQSISILERFIEQGRQLLVRYEEDQFTKWWHGVRTAVRNIFGETSKNLKEVERISFHPSAWSSDTPQSYFNKVRDRGISEVIATLESMVEEVKEYFEDDKHERPEPTKTKSSDQTVFIVHGHDNEAKEAVARFITLLGVRPVILHEQPNMGRTIIEKLEANSSVGFAVVLLTSDDIGASKRTPDNLLPRSRQNVILELGLFLGLLGRARVCALVKSGVEKPSDYDGVVYVSLDDEGAWKMSVVRELKAAGFAIDANKAFS